jgi:hypothetical protein
VEPLDNVSTGLSFLGTGGGASTNSTQSSTEQANVAQAFLRKQYDQIYSNNVASDGDFDRGNYLQEMNSFNSDFRDFTLNHSNAKGEQYEEGSIGNSFINFVNDTDKKDMPGASTESSSRMVANSGDIPGIEGSSTPVGSDYLSASSKDRAFKGL